MKLPALLLMCCLGVAAQGKVLFSSEAAPGTASFDGWELVKYGDGGSDTMAMPVPGAPGSSMPFIFNSGERNWCYLIREFSADELGDATSIRVRFSVYTNRPAKVYAAITDGITWGNALERMAGGRPAKALEWEEITLVMARYQPEVHKGLVSVAAGLDYNSIGAWCGIGRIVVEAFGGNDNSEAMLSAFDVPLTHDAFPVAWLKTASALSGVDGEFARYQEYCRILDETHGRDETRERELEGWRSLFQRMTTEAGTSDSWRELSRLRRQLQEWSYSAVWTGDWEAWLDAAPLPPGKTEARQFRTGRNMHETATLLLSNNTGEPANFQLKVSGPAAGLIQLYTLRKADGFYDCMVPLPQDGIVELGGRQTGGVEVVVATAPDTEPGRYEGTLSIVPLDNGVPVHDIALEVEVLPVVRPEALPIDVMNWDYALSMKPGYMEGNYLLDRPDFLLARRKKTRRITACTIRTGRIPITSAAGRISGGSGWRSTPCWR